MVLTIILILLIVGAGLVGALYSSFLVFYTNFGDTMEYNKAYYAAVSALERAELVLRYRKPGFQGTGGWMDPETVAQLPAANAVDGRPSSFWYFSGDVDNGVLWNITSRTNRIPKVWEGNVDWMLATGADSQNWNMLDYINAENISLMVDNLAGSPYTGGIVSQGNASFFTWIIKLPKLLKQPKTQGGYDFGDLDATSTSDLWNDGVYDDPIVDWSFRGELTDGSHTPFHVFSTSSIIANSRLIRENKDSVIRETRINNEKLLNFWGTYSPFTPSDLTGLTVISAKEDEVKERDFQKIMGRSSPLTFRIALLNLLKSTNKQIYPYLEYQFTFDWAISDRYYTIRAQGKYGDYKVELLVKKPTIKESILGTFTIIF